jgi:hypothetical protein
MDMIMRVLRNSCSTWRQLPRLDMLALLCGLMVLGNGCVSKDAATHIANFSSAVRLTITNSASAYELVEHERLNAEFSRTLLNYDGTLFKPSYSPFLTESQIQLRLDVLDGLKTYATRLSGLMNNTETNLDNDTTKLAGNLNKINQDLAQESFKNVPSVSSNDIAIFTAGVNALGHWILTLKAQRACKDAITNMQARMPGICGVFERDLDLMRNQLANDFDEEQRNSALYLKNNFSKLGPLQVRGELRRLIELAKAKKTAEDALAGTKESVEKLAAAHQSLDKAFTKDTKRLASLISAVSEEARTVSSYYNSLRTNN